LFTRRYVLLIASCIWFGRILGSTIPAFLSDSPSPKSFESLVLFEFPLMHYKVENSISPLVSETCLFSAGLGWRTYYDRFIGLEDSEWSENKGDDCDVILTMAQ
jgi:hypothetical protein